MYNFFLLQAEEQAGVSAPSLLLSSSSSSVRPVNSLDHLAVEALLCIASEQPRERARTVDGGDFASIYASIAATRPYDAPQSVAAAHEAAAVVREERSRPSRAKSADAEASYRSRVGLPPLYMNNGKVTRVNFPAGIKRRRSAIQAAEAAAQLAQALQERRATVEESDSEELGLGGHHADDSSSFTSGAGAGAEAMMESGEDEDASLSPVTASTYSYHGASPAASTGPAEQLSLRHLQAMEKIRTLKAKTRQRSATFSAAHCVVSLATALGYCGNRECCNEVQSHQMAQKIAYCSKTCQTREQNLRQGRVRPKEDLVTLKEKLIASPL
jgi:hypothetical protein